MLRIVIWHFFGRFEPKWKLSEIKRPLSYALFKTLVRFFWISFTLISVLQWIQVGTSILMLKLVLSIEVQEVRSNCCFKRNFLDYKSNYHVSGKNFIVQYLHSFYPLIRLSLFYQVKGTKHFRLLQRYTYRVLQTIPMKLILLCVWAKLAVLGSTKTALKFKYEI